MGVPCSLSAYASSLLNRGGTGRTPGDGFVAGGPVDAAQPQVDASLWGVKMPCLLFNPTHAWSV